MEITVEKQEGVTIVRLPGEQLDASNAKDFKRDIASILNAASKVVFDLSQLRFVDSSGLGAMLSCLRQVNSAGGELKLGLNLGHCSKTVGIRDRLTSSTGETLFCGDQGRDFKHRGQRLAPDRFDLRHGTIYDRLTVHLYQHRISARLTQDGCGYASFTSVP